MVRLKMNRFFDTAVGKTTKTFLWTLSSYLIVLISADVLKIHWSANYVALGVPGLVNLLLYSLKVITDKEVPTLPSSIPMVVVPKVDIIPKMNLANPGKGGGYSGGYPPDVPVIPPTIPPNIPPEAAPPTI